VAHRAGAGGYGQLTEVTVDVLEAAVGRKAFDHGPTEAPVRADQEHAARLR
jgi:hypothetical protein